MQLRTDLAIEARALHGTDLSGVIIDQRQQNDLLITEMEILSDSAARQLGKPKGKYLTIEGLDLRKNFRDTREHIETIASEFRTLLPEQGSVLAVGLGNRSITPDALGPESMNHILATRHIQGELAKSAGLEKLRNVSVISPGVLGQTGMEAGEVIESLVSLLSPKVVIVVDALVAKELSRLGSTIQLSNSGIIPGSGVGNHRMTLTKEVLGIPVIAVGVPTVADAVNLAFDLLSDSELPLTPDPEKIRKLRGQMLVTPREIDLLTERAAKLIGMSLNCALQTAYDFDTLAALS